MLLLLDRRCTFSPLSRGAAVAVPVPAIPPPAQPPFAPPLQYHLILFLSLGKLLRLFLHLVPDRLQNSLKTLLLCVYPLALLEVYLAIYLCFCPPQLVSRRRNSVAPLGVRSFYDCSMISCLVTQGMSYLWTSDAATSASANACAFSVQAN